MPVSDRRRSRRTTLIAAAISAPRPSRQPSRMLGVDPERIGALYVGNMLSGILAQPAAARRTHRRLLGARRHRGRDHRSRVRFRRRRDSPRLPSRRGRHSRRRGRVRRRAHDARRARLGDPRARHGGGLGARRRLRRIVPVVERDVDAGLHATTRRRRPSASHRSRSRRTATRSRIRMRCCTSRSTSTPTSPRGSSPIRYACSTSRRSATARRRSCSRRRTSPRSAAAARVRIAGSALATAPLALSRPRGSAGAHRCRRVDAPCHAASRRRPSTTSIFSSCTTPTRS